MSTQKKKEMALVIREVALTDRQRVMLAQRTPQEFVKTKPGRGGKEVKFVEGGYVTSVLNSVFGPLNWGFEVIAQGQSDRKTEKNAEGEVWVNGRLTVVDHVKGFKISKDQFGQHPIHTNVPVGDSFKAAATDALKKCASLFGVAADVYFKIAAVEEGAVQAKPIKNEPKQQMSTAQMFQQAKQMIHDCNDVAMLREWRQRIAESKLYGVAPKKQLTDLIDAKLKDKKG